MTGFKKIAFYLLVLANTIALFFLTAWFWSLPWLAGDEKLMIWLTSAIKFNSREIPPSEDYLLINTSSDLMLIDKTDDFGFPVGNQAITDRQKLYQLFRIINEHEPKPTFILCDIFFENPSEFDEELEKEMNKAGQLVISYHLDDNRNPKIPLFAEVDRGLSDYMIGNVFEGVYKFQLYFNDTLKLTPLLMHEMINGLHSKKYGPFVNIDNRLTTDHFIMNYRVLQKDIADMEAGFNPVNLGELLMLPEEDIPAYYENKVIVIGDFFDLDMHETIFENTAGPIILLNAYLSLVHEDTSVTLLYLASLFFLFVFLSYLAIYPGDLIEKLIKERYGRYKWVRNLTSFMAFLIILSTYSIITFFFYNIHLNVFFLSIYLFLVEKVSNLFNKKMLSKPGIMLD